LLSIGLVIVASTLLRRPGRMCLHSDEPRSPKNDGGTMW
jgi:hypothetical protein